MLVQTNYFLLQRRNSERQLLCKYLSNMAGASKLQGR